MFTGIVQEVGTLTDTRPLEGGRFELGIEGPRVLAGARVGDSICVDGVCLTVVQHDGRRFTAEAIPATLERTTLGELRPGDRVNLERALAAGEPLGGHIVQGHADGVGAVERVARDGDAVVLDVAVPDDVFGVTVLRGSIALAGVSLTVSGLPRPGVVQVSLIPHTLEHTTLGSLEAGARVNVEADLIAKLVAEQTRRWLEAHGAGVAQVVRRS